MAISLLTTCPSKASWIRQIERIGQNDVATLSGQCVFGR